jgi:hypothetical protein
MTYDEDTTLDDVLRAWDSGDTVWSVEMGGMGPGYEQAIQILAMECLREFKNLDWTADLESPEWDAAYREAGERAHHRLAAEGYSGAQYGAATNIAACFCRHGYAKALSMVDADRRIQVSRHWPVAPAPR